MLLSRHRLIIVCLICTDRAEALNCEEADDDDDEDGDYNAPELEDDEDELNEDDSQYLEGLDDVSNTFQLHTYTQIFSCDILAIMVKPPG